MSDSLVTMFDELRAQCPPVYDADGWRTWKANLAQVIQAMPRFEQRFASVALVADDVAGALPGVPTDMVFRSLAPVLLSAEDFARLQKGVPR